MAAIFDDDVFHHVGARSRIDADAAYVDASGLAGAEFIDFENVSCFDEHDFANCSGHGPSQLGMQLELPEFAMDRNEIFRPDQIDDELQFVLARVSADVDWRVRAVVVDDERLAAEQVIYHSVDGLL